MSLRSDRTRQDKIPYITNDNFVIIDLYEPNNSSQGLRRCINQPECRSNSGRYWEDAHLDQEG